jgi:NAD(P)-dependent dehydrogenase (short-subunit alcohol dehydrogenase family)
MNFKNKNIIITGSEGFLGKSLVNFFNKSGANVYGLDIAGKIKSTIVCDITNEDEVKKTFMNINSKGKVDILINNASINPSIVKKKLKRYKFSDYNINIWKKNIEVDLVGSFLMAKHALKVFEKYKKGTIINISSIYGLIGPDQSMYGQNKKFYGYKPIEYSVAKSGLIGFTKALASYYKGTNIKILSLAFGGFENNTKKLFNKKYSSKTIANRMANKEEFINYVSFFASDKSSYSNGACVVIDGGLLSVA